jgi:hypothetical protein
MYVNIKQIAKPSFSKSKKKNSSLFVYTCILVVFVFVNHNIAITKGLYGTFHSRYEMIAWIYLNSEKA